MHTYIFSSQLSSIGFVGLVLSLINAAMSLVNNANSNNNNRNNNNNDNNDNNNNINIANLNSDTMNMQTAMAGKSLWSQMRRLLRCRRKRQNVMHYLRSLLKQDKKRCGIVSTEAEFGAHASGGWCHVPRHISGAHQRPQWRVCRPPSVSDSETCGRPPWSRRPPREAEHAAGEGGVSAPPGVTGNQPRPGDGGGGLGKGLAGVWTKIQMLEDNGYWITLIKYYPQL